MRRLVGILLCCLLLFSATAENVTQDLVDAIAAAEQALAVHDDRTTNIESALAEYSKLLDGVSEIESRVAAYNSLIEQMEDLISQVNIQQLDHFNRQLSDILNAESMRRQKEATAATKPERVIEGVSLQQLDEMFDPATLLEDSEKELESWVRQAIEEELRNLASESRETMINSLPEFNEPVDDDDEHCVSEEKVAQEVQEALIRYSNDGIGLQDHALGGEIVYEMTSPTYLPPANDDERLGHGRWRRFIPDDVEDVLPKGWEDWNVKLPSFFFHLLRLRGASTASPRAILYPDTRPGSCWAFEGQVGHVTIRLPYPVIIDSVSVDHVSKHLLMKSSDHSSAPKNMKIYGYAPCDEKDCDGIGFDKRDGFLLKEIFYDIEGTLTQTFSFNGKDETEEIAKDDVAAAIEEEDSNTRQTDEDESMGSSCSAKFASCGSPQVREPVAAVRIEIASNWGNELYTCLYRVRVHGSKVS